MNLYRTDKLGLFSILLSYLAHGEHIVVFWCQLSSFVLKVTQFCVENLSQLKCFNRVCSRLSRSKRGNSPILSVMSFNLFQFCFDLVSLALHVVIVLLNRMLALFGMFSCGNKMAKGGLGCSESCVTRSFLSYVRCVIVLLDSVFVNLSCVSHSFLNLQI